VSGIALPAIFPEAEDRRNTRHNPVQASVCTNLEIQDFCVFLQWLAQNKKKAMNRKWKDASVPLANETFPCHWRR
jgi:hypothetical protein